MDSTPVGRARQQKQWSRVLRHPERPGLALSNRKVSTLHFCWLWVDDDTAK